MDGQRRHWRRGRIQEAWILEMFNYGIFFLRWTMTRLLHEANMRSRHRQPHLALVCRGTWKISISTRSNEKPVMTRPRW